MKILFNTLFFSLLHLQLFAQNDLYQQKTKAGADFLAAGKYAEAARSYSEAFESFGWRGYLNDRLNAARAWSMAGVPDSAFFNLFRLAERAGYDDLDALNQDRLFEPLRTDARWPQLCARVKSNQPTMPELMKTLLAVLENDQKYRLMIDSVEAATGRNSTEMQQLWKTISHHDSINEGIVTGMLDQYGWLGPSEVGASGSNALFLVIQHAPLPVQEKYLPMMREAVKAGKAQGSSLALLEDRVLMRNGKKQIYGSQVRSDPETGEKYFFPIEDVDQVDRRRAEVGLGPLAEYARHFGIEWNAAAIEKNKRMAPDLPEKH